MRIHLLQHMINKCLFLISSDESYVFDYYTVQLIVVYIILPALTCVHGGCCCGMFLNTGFSGIKKVHHMLFFFFFCLK